LYSDGSSAVASAIPAFCKKGDLLIVDEGCSEPIMTGANLSRSTVRYFRHNDVAHLESILEAIAKEDKKLNRDSTQQRRFIVTEAVFRNIGDLCPLKEILEVKEKYFYRLVLDETYAFGVLGKTGRGLTEYLGLKTDDVEVITLTLDTALGSVGGICVGRRGIVDHQRLSGAGYCFSASLAPFFAACAIAALQTIQSEPVLLQKLANVSKRLYHGFAKVPFLQLLSKNDDTGIFHFVLQNRLNSDLEEAMCLQRISDYCLSNGVAVVVTKYALLHARPLRPSLMICANAHWNDDVIHKITETIAKGAKVVAQSK
jgi:serine palmitoyltransferase